MPYNSIQDLPSNVRKPLPMAAQKLYLRAFNAVLKDGGTEEEARIALQELVSEGSLVGKFTEDGTRFFLSDVKVSEAPILAPADVGYEIETKSSKVPKMVVLSGMILIAIGFVLRGLTAFSQILENAGGAVIMIGLATLMVGWMMFSKMNPPSRKRL